MRSCVWHLKLSFGAFTLTLAMSFATLLVYLRFLQPVLNNHYLEDRKT